MGFHHSTGGHFDFPLRAHHICNARALAVEWKLLEVTINQGRPTMRFMEEETGQGKKEGRRKACMVKFDCGSTALHLVPALNSNFKYRTVSACIMHVP